MPFSIQFKRRFTINNTAFGAENKKEQVNECRQYTVAELFQRDRSVIGKHVRNIFKEGELNKESVWAKFAYTAVDGNRMNCCQM